MERNPPRPVGAALLLSPLIVLYTLHTLQGGDLDVPPTAPEPAALSTATVSVSGAGPTLSAVSGSASGSTSQIRGMSGYAYGLRH